MKQPGKPASSRQVVALALTWDGARWPVRTLPLKARAFLMGKPSKGSVLTSRRLSTLLANDQIKEMRVCWVPRLKGGREVLVEPFTTSTGKRITFRAAQSIHLGEILGVVYQRIRHPELIEGSASE